MCGVNPLSFLLKRFNALPEVSSNDAEAAGASETLMEGYDLVALVIDDKAFGDDELINALSVTIGSEKSPLRFVQSGAENDGVTKGPQMALSAGYQVQQVPFLRY
jgi:hypothetical protein